MTVKGLIVGVFSFLMFGGVASAEPQTDAQAALEAFGTDGQPQFYSVQGVNKLIPTSFWYRTYTANELAAQPSQKVGYFQTRFSIDVRNQLSVNISAKDRNGKGLYQFSADCVLLDAKDVSIAAMTQCTGRGKTGLLSFQRTYEKGRTLLYIRILSSVYFENEASFGDASVKQEDREYMTFSEKDKSNRIFRVFLGKSDLWLETGVAPEPVPAETAQ